MPNLINVLRPADESKGKKLTDEREAQGPGEGVKG